jgi:hypothetical protein
MKRLFFAAVCFQTLLMRVALAGEISGLPPHLLPTTSPDYMLYMGNDFLAIDTKDDYRTQQLIASFQVNDRWLALLEHSTLTRDESASGSGGRIDSMSLSLGYKLIEQRNSQRSKSLTFGTGIRAVGNFAGSRIQNGFHALIESETNVLPYETSRQTDATLWFVTERHQELRAAPGNGALSGWDTGYWARAAALATTDGQFDGVAGLYAVASRSGFDLWLGLRHDWRDGYDADRVQQETATQESKTALAYGARFGSVLIEAVQRFDSNASYGRISFTSSPNTRKQTTHRNSRMDLQLGLYLPHMMFQLAGRWPQRFLTDDNSVWRESLLVDLRAGQPQYGNDVTRFTRTSQLAVGLELSRPVDASISWLRYYTSGALGWRSEQLVGEGSLAGVKSPSIDKAVLQVDVGLEFDATQIRSHWRHTLRFGLSGWLPSKTVTVDTGGLASQLHQPGVSIAAVWNFSYQ